MAKKVKVKEGSNIPQKVANTISKNIAPKRKSRSAKEFQGVLAQKKVREREAKGGEMTRLERVRALRKEGGQGVLGNIRSAAKKGLRAGPFDQGEERKNQQINLNKKPGEDLKGSSEGSGFFDKIKKFFKMIDQPLPPMRELERLKESGEFAPEIFGEPVPIGAGGAVAGLAAKGFLDKSATGLNIASKWRNFQEAGKLTRVQNIVRKTSYTPGQVNKMLDKAIAGKEINAIVKNINPTTALIKGAVSLGGKIAATSVLVTWYAMDNIVTGAKFRAKDVLSALRTGVIDTETALESVQEIRDSVQIAGSLAIKNAELNPYFWPFTRTIITGIEADKDALELIFDQISGEIGFNPEQEVNAEDVPPEEINL